ncbi:MAG: hypothetical protein K9G41_12610, partial [Flavobacteriales bacterium]|nr:hypothetical protein [Flavobacteriales bacterium]
MKNLKMNCRILVSTLLITGMMMCTDVVFGQVVSDFEDAGCPTPSADAQGDCSAAIGSEAIVTGDLSVAVGRGASVSGFSSGAFGSAARAAGDNAIAVGDAQANGNLSSAFGQRAIALGERGMAIGNSVRTTATTSNNFIFGSGYDVGILENDISNSIMIGVNSNVSTMFIGNSGGTTGSFGNVGIGNITAPASLLHVRDEVRLGLTGSANGSLIFNNSAGDTISFNTPASMSDQNYTLPTALGVNGDVLTYTTGGQLTWTNGGTATDDWRLDGNNNATSSSKLGTLNAQ